MAEFFMEIGSEEIPAGYVEPALKYMEKELSSFFSRNRIHAKPPKTIGTSRRLIVSVKEVMEMQEDSEAEAAIRGLNEQPINGRAVRVNEARPREERPRRPAPPR